MADVLNRIVILAYFCLNFSGVFCRSNGAPTSACVSMLPGHIGVNEQPPSQIPLFKLETDRSYFTPTSPAIIVTLSGIITLQGLLLQARLVNTTTRDGEFTNFPDGFKILNCNMTANLDDSVTHANSNIKNGPLEFTWVASSLVHSDIEFVATVANTREIYWRQIKSPVVTAVGDVCEPNPCYNGGTCYKHSDDISFFCGCPDPSNMNRRCEDQCSPDPCINGGICYKSAISATRYLCDCTARYQGIHCQIEIDPCTTNPCLNGGVCQVSGDSYSCFCPVTHQGDNCENEVIRCSETNCANNATCIQTPTGQICLCAHGWSGETCTQNLFCLPDSCLNGGLCYDSNPSGSSMFHCDCSLYYTGSRCQTADPCRTNPCTNGGTCTQIGDTVDFTCLCVDGFEGNRCETTSNPCQSMVCMNGGTCVIDQSGSPSCQCPANFTGTSCEIRIHPCDMPDTPCLNEGLCYKGGNYGYACSCTDGYTGRNCENIVSPCSSDPCMNGGTCQFEAGNPSYVCACPVEYIGDDCQNQVNLCSSSPCMNGGTCQSEAGNPSYICVCPVEYIGDNCQNQVNLCSTSPCMNGGTCQFEAGNPSYVCVCPVEYIGDNCQNQGACFGVTCQNGGTCIPQMDQSDYTCQCTQSYSGPSCEYSNQACSGTPCENGGTCVPTGGSNYMCQCKAVYSGNDCGVYTDPCSPTNPCVHGTCKILIDSASGWECTCDTDYMGVDCSVYIGNPCDGVECLNGGQCISSSQIATCDCTADYTGSNCETPINPTFNGCPSGVNPSFPLRPGTNMAYIDLIITAMDSNSRILPLDVTDGLQFPTTIPYSDEYRNGKQITIQATDSDGRTSTCQFKLRLKDNEIPSVTCPSDVSAITTEDSVAVSFPEATASDNLGITQPLRYTPNNGSKFTAGSNNTVIVKAFDTFENKGECQFLVVVYKKESDCPKLTPPVNGVSTCSVIGKERRCPITCNEGFGNAVGTEKYMCKYTSNVWEPRPNMDICVTFKPGVGVSKTVSMEFTVDSNSCNSVNSVQSSLTSSLQAVGVCTSSTSCNIRSFCENDANRRRKRAPTDMTVEVDITSQANDGESTTDVLTRLNSAIKMVEQAVNDGSLSINVDGQITSNNQGTFEVSPKNIWHCEQGQKPSPDGCLSCPPGTFHDMQNNSCEYCDPNTYQNKPEQISCMKCPESTTTEQKGAYSVEHCGAMKGPVTSPWTPMLIGIIAGAGGLIILLLIVLLSVYVIKVARRPSQDGSHSSKTNPDGPLSNFTHLNRAYEPDEPEMIFHGGEPEQSTYQNVIDDDVLDTGSVDHLIRIPSLSQYSDYYATLNARSAVTIPESPQANGGPTSPPPAPPIPPPPPPELNLNNSNTRFYNGAAKLQV